MNYTFSTMTNYIPIKIREEKPMNTTNSHGSNMFTNTFTFTEMTWRAYNAVTAKGGE